MLQMVDMNFSDGALFIKWREHYTSSGEATVKCGALRSEGAALCFKWWIPRLEVGFVLWSWDI